MLYERGVYMATKKKEEETQEVEKYDWVTLRTHNDHKNFMRKNLGKWVEQDGVKQCATQKTVKCKNRGGFWKKMDFYKSENNMFDGHVPICKDCLIEMTSNSRGELSKKGLGMACMVLDIPFLQQEYESALEGKGTSLGLYMKSVMLNHSDKRFIDSDESILQLMMSADNGYDTSDIELSDELFLKWGRHYEKEDIISLEYNYNRYMNAYQIEGLVEEKLVEKICHNELKTEQDRAIGKDVSKLEDQYSKLIGTLKLKPEQQTKDSAKHTRLGNIAELIEQGKPIVNKDPAFEDVDNMTWYINNFFSQIFKVFGKSKINNEKPESKSGD